MLHGVYFHRCETSFPFEIERVGDSEKKEEADLVFLSRTFSFVVNRRQHSTLCVLPPHLHTRSFGFTYARIHI